MVRSVSTQDVMGALYEDVEKFFGDIFAWYGRLIARVPWLFVSVPILVCGLLGLGVFRMGYETQVEVLFTPIDSMVLKDQAHLQEFFQDKTAESFYPWQQITRASYGEVILKRSHANHKRKQECPNNILKNDSLRDIQQLNRAILNITVQDDTNQTFSFKDVCALRNRQCVVDGLQVLKLQRVSNKQQKFYYNTQTTSTASDHTNMSLVPVVMTGSLNLKNQTCYEVLRIRYNLRHNSSIQRVRGLMWEKQFLATVSKFQSHVMDVYYTVSESLDIELKEHVDTDTKFLGFSVLGMLTIATIIGSGINCVTNHVTLAYAGVFSSMMAILAALGVLSLIGVKYVNLCGVMPFLVLGIGADDVFQLLSEWRQSHIRESIEERMASTMRSTAVAITITSLTDIMAFCIGATSPYVSIRNFCAFSGVAIFLCYMSQLTFYGGCIVLHARRVQASRHWITCCPTKSKEQMEEEGASAVKVFLCSGSPPRRIGEEGGICRKLSRILYTYYPKFLLHWITKCAVFFLFIVYISISLFGALRIKQGLKLEQVVPKESYLTKYMAMEEKYFHDDGPTVTFLVQGPNRFNKRLTLYHETVTWDDVRSLLKHVENEPTTVNGSVVSWLDSYLSYRHQHNLSTPHSERHFILGLQEFFKEYPSFKEDVKFSEDLTYITASRFYIRCKKMYDSADEGEMMMKLRRIANSSPLSVIAYSPDFAFYEHYVSVLKNTLLPVCVTMIGLLFVALVFIPHPIAVTCVTIAMISVAIGMVGFLHFWGESLGVITVIQIIMSLGICISFTVHMTHSFMTATGKNRNERVTVALEKVGIPILNGALSSLVSALMLSFGASFIFTSFFKTMILVSFLGTLHSLVFIPVMLSFIGPRRTSKPRVFIPVSASSRSLQDTFRVNSIVHQSPSDACLDRNSRSQKDKNSNTTGKDFQIKDMRTIENVDDPSDIQINIEDVDGDSQGTTPRKVSFAMGDTPSIHSELFPPRPHEVSADVHRADVPTDEEDVLDSASDLHNDTVVVKEGPGPIVRCPSSYDDLGDLSGLEGAVGGEV